MSQINEVVIGGEEVEKDAPVDQEAVSILI